MVFDLDKRLSNGSKQVIELPLSTVRLKDNCLFPWLILIPRRDKVTELYELDATDQAQLTQEMVMVSQRLKNYTKADKMNIATLGNQVPQLHVHIVARFQHDQSWPYSIWHEGAAEQAYELSDYESLIGELQDMLK